jgi:hypothetical protein
LKSRARSLIFWVGLFCLLFSVGIGVAGYGASYSGWSFPALITNLLKDFYANLSSELLSIAITLLIIDLIYDWRSIETERLALKLQMGSTENIFAREAVRLLRVRKWLFDRSMTGSDFTEADLSNSDLRKANLRCCILRGAELVGADLRGADLREADLQQANLTGADLRGANLLGADFEDAILKGADLTDAKVNEDQLKMADC